MRQKNEYQVLDWRRRQAELWRDDVRDIIGLTEKKMDTYTIVSALQLAMCVALFTEGRLAPGTPPWLLHFYMLTLSAAFLYLLMSVWLALHASVVAQCCSARLLTQFVRLPVPTWEELEGMRTYAQSVERLGGKHMLRVPFLESSRPDAAPEPPNPKVGRKGDARADEAKEPERPFATCDPWGSEAHGDHRNIYELQQVPAKMRRHIGLAERAAEQYKCFDAFARVAMTFGTNQLLHAVTYYCLGYVSIQDGAPWAAWSVGAIMATISAAMVSLDLSLTRREQLTAQVLVLAGPVCASSATWLWALTWKDANSVFALLFTAYAAHALWLLWALQACGVRHMPCGSVLPTRFRAVLYLDIFGWLTKHEPDDRCSDDEIDRTAILGSAASTAPRSGSFQRAELHGSSGLGLESPCARDSDSSGQADLDAGGTGNPTGHYPDLAQEQELAHAGAELERPRAAQRHARGLAESGQPEEVAREQRASANSAFTCSAPWAVDHHEVRVRELGILNTIQEEEEGGQQSHSTTLRHPESRGPSGAISHAPSHAFAPTSFLPDPHADLGGVGEAEIVTGHDRIRPGILPWTIFRSATLLLAALWGTGLALPFGTFRDIMTKPLIPELHVESGEDFVVGTDPSGLPEYIPKTDERNIPELPEGELIRASWPSHSGFQPRALSSTPLGTQLVVADDFGVYTGQVFAEQLAGPAPARALRGEARGEPRREVPSVLFQQAPPCTALEGQALKDISVICSAGDSPVCHVLVLHAHGRRLVQCPLLQGWTSPASVAAAPQGRGLWPAWEISSDWLHDRSRHDREAVDSVAVDNGCLGGAFHADGIGCVVVGTTSGRIVQLRGHSTNQTRLIPERAVQQWPQAVKQGSLHVLPNGCVVALRRHTGSIEAFDARIGKLVGEWRLPSGIAWMMLAAGSDDLFVLGRGNGTEVKLYRFPLPQQLRSLMR